MIKETYIYGIQGIAMLANEAIEELNPERNVKGFIVTRPVDDDKIVSGKPVFGIDRFAGMFNDDEKENVLIYIGSRSSMHMEIEESLEQHGFHHYVRLTPERWSELVKLYFVKKGMFRPLATLPVGEEEPFVRVYVVKSHKDTPTDFFCEYDKYMIPIQAGAAMTDCNIARVKDNVGDNISEKNGCYCEMSALYSIWKKGFIVKEHEKKCYYGMIHYRRRLNLTEDDFRRAAANDVDVIMPYPYPHEPNIGIHHSLSMDDRMWDIAVRVVEELYPDYASDLPEIMESRYMYVCNIVFARGYVMEDYCRWIFSILERVEKEYYSDGLIFDRKLGYLAETLTAIYFLLNKNSFIIAHTDFLELT